MWIGVVPSHQKLDIILENRVFQKLKKEYYQKCDPKLLLLIIEKKIKKICLILDILENSLLDKLSVIELTMFSGFPWVSWFCWPKIFLFRTQTVCYARIKYSLFSCYNSLSHLLFEPEFRSEEQMTFLIYFLYSTTSFADIFGAGFLLAEMISNEVKSQVAGVTLVADASGYGFKQVKL